MTAQLQYLVTRDGQRVKLPWFELTDAEQSTFQFVHLASERLAHEIERLPRIVPLARQRDTREYDLGQHVLTIDAYRMTLILAEKPIAGMEITQEIRLDEQGLYRLHTTLLQLFAR